MFHALTGCDTVSGFTGHGKRKAWATWKAFPELTTALIEVQRDPEDIAEDALMVVERFVVLLYDRTNTCSNVDAVRRKLFIHGRSVEAIPPTSAALLQHLRRAIFQAGYVWHQMLSPMMNLPDPADWGWQTEDDPGQWCYTPRWTTLPEASALQELVSCGCQKGCKGRCKCKHAGLKCTDLCKCEGICEA